MYTFDYRYQKKKKIKKANVYILTQDNPSRNIVQGINTAEDFCAWMCEEGTFVSNKWWAEELGLAGSTAELQD